MDREKDEIEVSLRSAMLLAREGDPAAYRRLLEALGSVIRAYLRRKLRTASVEQIEDLLQEILLAIHRKKHLYDPAQPLLPWVFAIARYRMIDAYRKKTREPRLEAETDDLEIFPTNDADPEQALAQSQALREASELLAGLKPRQLEILLAAKLDQLPLADIASQQDMSLSAVKVTLHRVTRSLKSLRKQRSAKKM